MKQISLIAKFLIIIYLSWSVRIKITDCYVNFLCEFPVIFTKNHSHNQAVLSQTPVCRLSNDWD